jgi:hypothetical protein
MKVIQPRIRTHNHRRTDKNREILYPIIPILFSSSSLSSPSLSDESKTSEHLRISTSNITTLVSSILVALESETAINTNLPEQTEEILQQLRNPCSKMEIRRMKKTSYTYHSIPKKVRESISSKYPTSLGTACGIGEYGVIRIYVVEEEYESASKYGFHCGDVIVDCRTRTMSPLILRKTSETYSENEEAVGFVLPVESHCVADKMKESLSDFIQLSLLPLSVSVSRYVSSNRAGGLEACPKWRGVVVSGEIREALEAPSGWIYRELKEKWGVSVAVEDSSFCPEIVEHSGMRLVSRISW